MKEQRGRIRRNSTSEEINFYIFPLALVTLSLATRVSHKIIFKTSQVNRKSAFKAPFESDIANMLDEV